MSGATSIQGLRYEQHFRKGFVRQNAGFMANPTLEVGNKIVYGVDSEGMRTNDPIGDIDGYYVASESKFLRDLLPVEHRLSDYDFAINEGDEVYFELTTQYGNDLWKTPAAYIQKKVSFHEALVSGGGYGWNVDKAIAVGEGRSEAVWEILVCPRKKPLGVWDIPVCPRTVFFCGPTGMSQNGGDFQPLTGH
jgi:hypothetical protein